MGLFTKKSKEKITSVKMVHQSGLPGVPVSIINLTIDEANKLLSFDINSKHTQGATNFKLSFDKIISAEKVKEETLKQRSGLGRAVVGGVLLGSTGAVVGAMTKKDKKQVVFYRVIKYKSANNEENEIILRSADLNEPLFFNKLNGLIMPEIYNSESVEL